jgi:hypothetical protein
VKGAMDGTPEGKLRRPSDRRPAWEKISSLPDIMVRPDERRDIKTFVNGTLHNSPFQTKNKALVDRYCESQLAPDQSRTKVGDHTTRHPRALRHSSHGATSRSPKQELRTIVSPFSTEESDSVSSGSKRCPWSPTKQPKKSAMKKSSKSSLSGSTHSSTYHNLTDTFKDLSVFDRAACKKKESRWNELTKVTQADQKRTERQCSPLKSPTRHVSTDSLSVASSMPPLTVCDFDDCTHGTTGTYGSASLDLGSLESPRDNVKENLRKRSKQGKSDVDNLSGAKKSEAQCGLCSRIQTTSNRVKKVLDRGGSDCSPTTVSEELLCCLTEISSEKNSEVKGINPGPGAPTNTRPLLCTDINTRAKDRHEPESRCRDAVPQCKPRCDVEKSEVSARSQSTRSRSISPPQGNITEDQFRSLSLDKRKHTRTRKTKEHRSQSGSEEKAQISSRSSGSTRREGGARDNSRTKRPTEADDKVEAKTHTQRHRRGTSNRSRSRVRSDSNCRSNSPTNRNQSKSRCKSRSTSPRSHRSELSSKSRSRNPRRHHSSSRTRCKSQSPKPSRSKSTSRRRQRKDMHGAATPTTKARKQEDPFSEKLADHLQASYGSIDTRLCSGKSPCQDPLFSSLTALDYIAATRQTESCNANDLMASGGTTKTRSNFAQERNSNLPSSQKWEYEIIPISTLLPPKKTSTGGLLEGRCGSLHLNNLDTAHTSSETVKRSGNPNLSSDPFHKRDTDVPLSTLIHTGSTEALVKIWEEEISRSTRHSSTSTNGKTMTWAKMERRSSTGTTIEWVETALEP